MMEFGWHDWLAWAICLGTTALFTGLLCWNGYTDWREEERRKSRRKV